MQKLLTISIKIEYYFHSIHFISMNRYVLITSMKPVFDCFNVTTRAKLRRTCKWCNKHIRRHLNKIGAQLIIRRVWYYYKLHKNLCISSPFTSVENLKMVIPKSLKGLNAFKMISFNGPSKAYTLTYAKEYLKLNSQKDLRSFSFKDLIKKDTELITPVYSETIERGCLKIIKSCYIRLYGNHKNLTINLKVGSEWISANIPENAIAVRIHFGSLPLCAIQYNDVNVLINYPFKLQRRYLHGSILDCDNTAALSGRKLEIDNKIFIEAFYHNGSKQQIGNVVNKYIVWIGQAVTENQYIADNGRTFNKISFFEN
jgi:hypothetical protein